MSQATSEKIATLSVNNVPVVDTFAEAFGMVGTRLIITAAQQQWADIAAGELCGYATSVIACDVEAAIERTLSESETPDGRPGVAVLVFSFSQKGLEKAVTNRVGQCVLTCPTTACYNGLPDITENMISVGGNIRFFGDGFQISKKLGTRRLWRMPVMDGEFVCEDKFGTLKGIGGGNLIICAASSEEGLTAATAAANAMRTVRDIILPFPGGIVRSGSKVGSRYAKLKASTNDAYCPTLMGLTPTELPEGTAAVYEIVIDGFSFDAIQSAMQKGLQAAVNCTGITRITAGNYGGKLGKHHFHLRDIVTE
ncbi:Formylmethanofuran--tetrahydromethanopterin N-formyltransferase [hydrothermal vent metagenome]|uniref:Formylmethanofuran--tetrahydromethanopterin N-formyltransferase n=1 Tax=hydrothermal vent metagenome TaxID=652676 RepID=A0A3B1DU88_9ZZZZ